MRQKNNKRLLIVPLAALGMLCGPYADAQNPFDFNFLSVSGGTPFFGISGTTETLGDGPVTSQTPFLYETVTDPNTSITYYHMVLGSTASGFAQEVYIENNSSFGIFQGGPSSASPGDGGGTGLAGNRTDPLGVIDGVVTGDGSGNPTKVIMRQVMDDPFITSEFLKDNFTNKPKITQDIASADMTSHVLLDMSNSDYGTSNAPGAFVNTVSATTGGTPFAGSFNMASDAQKATVTAGEYSYAPGAGGGDSGGTYNYADGDSTGVESSVVWEVFWDPAEPNPWVDATNHP